MRAVNLVPPDLRRGGGAPTRSGVGVYVLLGGMAVFLVVITAWVLVNNSIKANETKLADANNAAAQAEAQAARLKPYTDFAALRKARVDTVASLAASRFDWDKALRQTARVLPSNVWLTTLNASIAPGAGGAAGGDTGQLRQQVASPAIELVGCTVGQSDVARVLSRLRQMDGVTRVSLASSDKADNAGGATSTDGGAGTSGGDCRNGNRNYPQFQIVVFFQTPEAPTAPPAAGTAPTTEGASTTAPSGGAQPASTGGTQ